MKITLYQIIPEPENRYLIFSDLRSIRAASGGHVPAEIYEAVFSGNLDIAVPGMPKTKWIKNLPNWKRYMYVLTYRIRKASVDGP